MMRAVFVALVCAALYGCAHVGDEFRTPAREPCQVWVRIDNGPWRCYSRAKVRREVCEIAGPC